jgi:hypothetical protein
VERALIGCSDLRQGFETLGKPVPVGPRLFGDFGVIWKKERDLGFGTGVAQGLRVSDEMQRHGEIMKAWKKSARDSFAVVGLTVAGLGLIGAECFGSIPQLGELGPRGRVVTGQRGGTMSTLSLNLPQDLSEITDRSKHEGRVVFPSPSDIQGVYIPNSFDPNHPLDRNGNLISPDLILPCTPRLGCGSTKVTSWTQPGDRALWTMLGSDALDEDTYLSARDEKNQILVDYYDLPAETSRKDYRSLPARIDDFDVFAGDAAD